MSGENNGDTSDVSSVGGSRTSGATVSWMTTVRDSVPEVPTETGWVQNATKPFTLNRANNPLSSLSCTVKVFQRLDHLSPTSNGGPGLGVHESGRVCASNTSTRRRGNPVTRSSLLGEDPESTTRPTLVAPESRGCTGGGVGDGKCRTEGFE